MSAIAITRSPLPGVAAGMFVAVTLVVCGDTAGKALTGLGVHPFVIGWMRFALGLGLLAPVLGSVRSNLRGALALPLALRGGLIACGIASILTALRTEPFADVFGAFFIGPAVSYLLSTTLLKERSTVLRGLLIGLGFVGVLMVVQPGIGFRPGMIFALLAGVFYGSYLTMTRLLAMRHPARTLLFSQLLWGTLLLAPFGLWQAGSVGAAGSAGGAVLVLVSAMGSAAGNYLIVRISRAAPGTVVAPLVYLQLVSAAIMGWAVFGTMPDRLALAGLAVITGSGLASLWFARGDLRR